MNIEDYIFIYDQEKGITTVLNSILLNPYISTVTSILQII
jgi:hypothetical protein